MINGITYYYKVSALNIKGEGILSSEAVGTPATIPDPPSVLTAISGDNNVSLSWNSPNSDGGSPLIGYTIYRSTTSGTGFVNTATLVSLNYVDLAVSNGITYYYKVTANNSIGQSGFSNEISSIPSQKPTAPQNLNGTADDSSVSLSWDIPTNDGGSAILGYNVYRGTVSGGPYTNIATVTILSYVDNSVTNGITFHYVITAFNVKGESVSSNELQMQPFGPPTQPLSLSGLSAVDHVNLTWITPSNNGGSPITQYSIYRSITGGGPYIRIVNITGITNYTDNTVSSGTQYFYVVTAWNVKGESVNSNEIQVTTANVPSPPINLIAVQGDSLVSISWTPPTNNGSSDLTIYIIYRSISSGSGYLNIAETTTEITFYNDSTVTNGVTYYYVLTASNSEGEGQFSTEVSAKPATVPSIPTNIVISSGNRTINLNWDIPSNGGDIITSYNILRSTTSGSNYALISVSSFNIYNDTGLTNGVMYYYMINAINSVGTSANSTEISATPSTIPSAPVLLSPTPSIGYLNISWTAPNDDGGSSIDSYNVYRALLSNGPYTKISTVSVLEYNDTSVSNGVTYYYKISASNIRGEGLFSNVDSSNPGFVPSIPQSLTSTNGNNLVNISWIAPSNNGGLAIIEFRIYRSTISGSGYSQIGTSLSSIYLDSSVTNGNTYYYVVTAVNSKGESLNSNEIISNPATTPSSPQTFNVVAGDKNISIIWAVPISNGGSNIIDYNIYRSNTSGSNYSLIDSVGFAVTTYTDSVLTNGVSYYYIVKATNIIGEGLSSVEKTAIPFTIPQPPSNIILTNSNGQVDLSWSSPIDNGGFSVYEYRVYRSNIQGGSYTSIANVTSGTSYIDTNVVNGNIYYYVISSVSVKGESIYSGEITGIPANKPRPVDNLSAIGSNNTITLSWLYPVDDGGYIVNGYHIYRSITSGSNYTYIGSNTSTNGYLDSNLINGQTYYYYVVAETTIGNGTASFEVFETPGTVPTSPINILLSIGDKNISINWIASNNNGFPIIEYLIYRSTTSGTSFILIKSVIGDATSYVDSNLLVGTTYYYYIIAKNIKGESIPSVEVSTTVATYPNPVISFDLILGNSSARLDWIAPADDGGSPLTGFEIYRSITSGSGYSLITTVNEITTFYIDYGLTNGVTYYYVIKSLNFIGASTPSAEKTIKPGSKPEIPTNFKGISGNSNITLEWTEPNDGGYSIIEYRIYRSQTPGSGFFILANITSTTYVNIGLINGQQYYYKVLAVNQLGSSAFTSEISVTPSTIPAAPSNTSHIDGYGWIMIYWGSSIDDGGSQITGYKIYRSMITGESFDLIATLSVDIFEYNDTSISLDSTIIYFYVLTAKNLNGESLFSNEISGSSVNPVIDPNSQPTLSQPTLSKPIPSTTSSETQASVSIPGFSLEILLLFGFLIIVSTRRRK
ncbi:MAG: Amylopullulanase precursor [Candidatus Heimdallarchaeota archaeon LC_3]|nr:MAG: Amylopullulanase precursor [Candidatus Heimdallarchaeota archaeon LC_3]